MRISVVVATFNRPALLQELLKDLASQEHAEPFDVTVVDDGSKTPVDVLLRDVHQPYPMRVITQVNAGPARARDRGIAQSTGEIIVILDDDMRLPNDYLAAHRRLHENGADVVLGLIKPARDLHQKPIFERFHAAQLAQFVDSVRAGKPAPGSALCTGNVSFRRAYYQRVGGFDGALARSEDRDLGIRLERAGARFAFSEDGYSEHGSDHTDRAVWKRRAFLYGVYDHKIGLKFRDDVKCDPWHYIELVHPLSRPLLLMAVLSMPLGEMLSEAALVASEQLDRVGFERLAIKGTTLVFGLEYFRGVRSEHANSLSAFSELGRFIVSRMQLKLAG